MNDRALRLEVLLSAIDRATAPIKSITGSSKGLATATREARERLRELEGQSKRLESFRETARAASIAANELKSKQARLKELKTAMAETVTPSKQLVREFERVRGEAHTLATRHTKLIEKQQRLRTELEASGTPTRELATHQRALRQKIDEATGALERQQRALTEAGTRMRRLAEARAQYEKTLQTRNQLASSGAGALAAGGAALYSGAHFLAPGKDFEKSMSRVQALAQLDKASAEFKALRDQAIALGAATSFTASQAAEAQGFLAMAGFNSQKIIDTMPGMLDLAKAGGTDLMRTADIASNILSAFGMEAKQMGRVGDVLTKAFTSSNVSLETLAETMKYVGPVAVKAGMSLEQSAAMAGLLGNIGLQGSMAGTALRAMTLRLAAPPKAARDALDELKVSAKDAQGNVRQIPEVLYDIAKATERMGSGDRLGHLKAIFGEEAAAGMADLLERGGSGELQKYIAILETAHGTAARTAAVMGDNLDGDVLALGSAWESLGISVFDTQNGPLRSLIQTLTEVVRGVTTWANANPELVGTLVSLGGIIATAVAGVGALLLSISAVLGPLALAKLTLTTLGLSMGAVSPPVLMVVGAVLALAAGAYLIWRNWDPIKQFFVDLWAGITSAAGAAADWFASLPGRFIKNAADIAQGVRGAIGKVAGGLWDSLRSSTEAALTWLASLPERFRQFGADMIAGLVAGIRGAIGSVREAVTGAGEKAVGWFKEKLGIKSPSRVFAQLGAHTMDGYSVGLERRAGGPLGVLGQLVRQLTAAAGVGLAGAGVALAGGDVAIDTRPTLTARTAPAPVAGSTYQITVHAAPGMDEQALARAIAREIERHEQQSAARRRSRLSDME